MGFTQNLLNLEVKEVVAIHWVQYHCGIGATGASPYADNLLIGAHQPGIRRHQGYLTGDLGSLTEDAQGVGDDISDSYRVEFAA